MAIRSPRFPPVYFRGIGPSDPGVSGFENLWITGFLHGTVVVRSTAIASFAVIAVLFSRIAGGDLGGLTPAESGLGVCITFLGGMALSAIGRPRPERFTQDA